MKLYDDAPIKEKSEDQLNKSDLAKEIALNLLSIPQGKNFIVAINGE